LKKAALLLGGLALLVAAALLAIPRLHRADSGEDWYRIARAYQAERNYLGAGEAYRAAEKAGLATPEFFNSYGEYQLQNSASPLAEANFRRALAIDRRYGPAHANLAEVYMLRDQWDSAAQEFAVAASLIPGRAAELYSDAGMLYTNLKRPSDARTMYERALQARPGFQPALDGIARLEK
jgi:Flp pilus assembly protein TadD